METNKELMRAEFEAAYGPKEGFAWLNPDNTYKSQAIQDGWEVWQKAWQAHAALSQRSADAVDAALLSALRVAKSCIQHYQYGGSSFKKQPYPLDATTSRTITSRAGEGELM